MSDEMAELIIATAAEVADEHGIELEGELTRETRLFGRTSFLDSLALVALIVAVEQAIADRLDVAITLASEEALSRSQSPFRTIGSLADYATELLDATKNG